MSLAAEITSAANKAVDQWREVVFAAVTGVEPSLPALSKIADALGISTNEALAKLQADVGIVRERNLALAQLRDAETTIAQRLEPFGGSEPAFRAAVDAAEHHAHTLRGEYRGLIQGNYYLRSLHEATAQRIELGRPDLFPTPTVTG